MAAERFGNVDEYLASLDDTRAETIRRIISAVMSSAPGLSPVIAWNVPQIKRADGKYVFGVSAATKHISLAPWSKRVMASFADRLTAYSPTEGMFRVPVNWDVDTSLISDLVTARLAELDA